MGFDWSGASIVADIGGGNGSLLSFVLDAQRQLRGLVFDLPHVVAEAGPVIEAAGLSGRCETVGGDFFTDALPGADIYVLAQILHDWDDEHAVEILRNCRRSIAGAGRLLVLEQMLPEGDEPSYAKLLDLIMLVVLGGRERTEAEWRALLREGGFQLLEITPGPTASLIGPHRHELLALPTPRRLGRSGVGSGCGCREVRGPLGRAAPTPRSSRRIPPRRAAGGRPKPQLAPSHPSARRPTATQLRYPTARA